jgi:hypothetical protein
MARSRILLVLAACVMALQPFTLALSLRALSSDDLLADDLQVVICSSHGLMVLGPDGEPAPVPGKLKPPCPWCAVGAGPSGLLPAIIAQPIGILIPPLVLRASMEAVSSDPPLPKTERPSRSPRAPPIGAIA